MPTRRAGIGLGVHTNGLVVLLTTLAVAAGFGIYRRARDGRLRTAASRDTAAGDVRLTPADVGAELGRRATLVHFSTAFCQPCRAVRTVLHDVAAMVDGVADVEVDAEANLALVRRLGVMRTPTVLVLDADGRIVRRGSGVPRKADVIAALGEAIP
jgi:thiol-disulfide isomerase/thioredoxin